MSFSSGYVSFVSVSSG